MNINNILSEARLSLSSGILAKPASRDVQAAINFISKNISPAKDEAYKARYGSFDELLRLVDGHDDSLLAVIVPIRNGRNTEWIGIAYPAGATVNSQAKGRAFSNVNSHSYDFVGNGKSNLSGLNDAGYIEPRGEAYFVLRKNALDEAKHIYDLPSSQDTPSLPANAVRSTFFYNDKKELLTKLQSTKGLLSVSLMNRWASGGFEFMLADTKKTDKKAPGYLKFGSWHDATLEDAIYNAASSGEATIYIK